MAVLRQRISKRQVDGTYIPLHFETSSDLVLRPDGTNIEQSLNPAALGAAPESHTHDDRYTTTTDLNTALAEKSDTSHKHTAAEVGARPVTWTPTAEDVGALPDTTVIPTNVSQLANDKKYATTSEMDTAISSAIGKLVNGAPESGDTLMELFELIGANKDAMDLLNAAIAEKAAKSVKINGHDLSADVNLTPDDVGALAADGTATSATKLATSRSIKTDLGSETAGNFNGTDNVTPGVTGTLPVSHGGTGATTAAAALTALGAAAAGHGHTASEVGALSANGTAAAATKLASARTIDGVSFNGTDAISHYGTCSTAAGTKAKVVALTGFTLATGARVFVKFTATNTAASPTLNVNSTGAKNIMYRGAAITAGYLAASHVYEFVYDGTNYELVGDIDTHATLAELGGMNASQVDAAIKAVLANYDILNYSFTTLS